MPGTPFLWALHERIEALGGEDWFFGQVAEDVPMKDLGKLLGCDRKTLYRWIELVPERKEMLAEARRIQAHNIVEDQAHDMRTKRLMSNVEVQQMSARAKFTQWRAERFNRAEFGEEKSAQVVLNIGSLHARELRARVAEALPPVVEAEIVEA